MGYKKNFQKKTKMKGFEEFESLVAKAFQIIYGGVLQLPMEMLTSLERSGYRCCSTSQANTTGSLHHTSRPSRNVGILV